MPETSAAIAAMMASFDAMKDRLEDVAADAREARDSSNKALTILAEQKVGERLGEMHEAIKGVETQMRADLVNAVTKAREEAKEGDVTLSRRIDASDARLDALEAERDKEAGARGVIHWLSKNAPWLLAIVVAAADVLHIKLPWTSQ